MSTATITRRCRPVNSRETGLACPERGQRGTHKPLGTGGTSCSDPEPRSENARGRTDPASCDLWVKSVAVAGVLPGTDMARGGKPRAPCLWEGTAARGRPLAPGRPPCWLCRTFSAFQGLGDPGTPAKPASCKRNTAGRKGARSTWSSGSLSRALAVTLMKHVPVRSQEREPGDHSC